MISISMINWILFAIFIFGIFATDKIKNTNDYVVNWTEILNIAAMKGNKEHIKLALNAFYKEENKKLIEILMKGNEINITVLHWATYHGQDEIVKLLFDIFPKKGQKEKLIDFVMKTNNCKDSCLHFASNYGHEGIVRLLLNVFSDIPKEKEKLIEFVMKENNSKATALHFASYNGHEKIVTALLDVFGKEDEEILIDYLTKEDMNKMTALNFASNRGHEGIVNLLLNVFSEEKNYELNQYVHVMNENNFTNTALHRASHHWKDKLTPKKENDARILKSFNDDDWPNATGYDRTYEGTFELLLKEKSKNAINDLFGEQFPHPHKTKYPYCHMTLMLIKFNSTYIRTINDAKKAFRKYGDDLKWLRDGLNQTIAGIQLKFQFNKNAQRLTLLDKNEELINGLRAMKNWIDQNWGIAERSEPWIPLHISLPYLTNDIPDGTIVTLKFHQLVFTPRPSSGKQVKAGKIWKEKRFDYCL